MAGILSKTLSEVHPSLRTNGMGIGNTHRRISLGFLPPNKKNPLVRKFRARTRNIDQRSFRSLTNDFGSNVHEPNPYLGNIDEEPDLYYHDEEDGELSRTISLPSRVSETPELSPQDVDWILHEHERRYSSVCNSDNEEARQSNTPDRIQQYSGRELEYDEFMNRLQAQKQKLTRSAVTDAKGTSHHRRPSFVSVTSRGSVPTIYQEIDENDSEALAELAHSHVTFKSEARVLASYSFPLIFTFLLEQIFPMVCSLTVGHLGKNELAAVSLASMTSNITLAIFEGIATSLDTLCPQAYGSGRFYSVGVHLQRCIAFSLVIYIPFAVMWWYSEPLLSYIIPEKELINLTSRFLRVLILGAPAYIFFENLKRFLQAQGIFDAGIYVLTICAPLNVLVSYTLVWNKYIGVGFIGAAIAVVLNFWLMFFLLLFYALYIDGRKCWGGFSRKAFTHWNDLGHLAFSGIIMLEAEELSYELLTLFSAYYGVSYLAAQSAVSTMAALLYMIPFAIGISTSTRIANFIGAKRTDFAHISSQVGLSFSFIAGFINCCILVFGRNLIANIYSKDPEVIKLIAQVLPLVGIVQNFDSLNAVAGSCLRGQGMQSLGSIVNLMAYYLFGIPLALILSWFFDMKLYGLWIGIGSAMLLIGLVEAYYVLFPDWDKIMTYAEILKETEDDEVDSDEYLTDSDDPDENTALLGA
ncbi:AFI_G0011800.mRNA.1.CDS.1 [Saccharomyces cerevisiae]|nr:AFI_G0011800.mRNA.1.CDS.1 [Saccharomyces cerevisiae]CAI6576999.1 AFI_G0011800.mRNA.1.CDS.1 [Saccharomyces cerevisiae]